VIALSVNGAEHRLDVDPETPLLYVLRNELGLVGTRFGCGVGLCGSCTVMIGSRAVRSCNTPVGAVNGPVTTVEGLGGDHPLQRALLEEQAGQCGYCLSGIIMSAAALLGATPHPSRSEIRLALDDNICRCGSHPRILRSIERVAGIAG
jgi:aerobic-type carbon monoxide dehydrogenase small subunit (CoxS/CutS family)